MRGIGPVAHRAVRRIGHRERDSPHPVCTAVTSCSSSVPPTCPAAPGGPRRRRWKASFFEVPSFRSTAHAASWARLGRGRHGPESGCEVIDGKRHWSRATGRTIALTAATPTAGNIAEPSRPHVRRRQREDARLLRLLRQPHQPTPPTSTHSTQGCQAMRAWVSGSKKTALSMRKAKGAVLPACTLQSGSMRATTSLPPRRVTT